MTPVEAVADLDREIAEHGSGLLYKQGDTDVPVQAFIRGYKPEEFANGVIQGDTLITLSQTGALKLPADEPRVGDKVFLSNRMRRVMAVEPVLMLGVAVRFNLQVRG